MHAGKSIHLSSSSSSASYYPDPPAQSSTVRAEPSSLRRPLRKSLAIVVLSAVCIVSGLVLVLCVTIFYISPATSVHLVQCNIERLKVRTRRQQQDAKDTSQKTPPVAMTTTTATIMASSAVTSLRCVADLSFNYSESSTSLCLMVRASYVLFSGARRFGYIRRSKTKSGEDEDEVEFIEEETCYCVNCCSIPHESLAFGSSWSSSRSVILTGNQTLLIGDVIDCLVKYHRSSTRSQTPMLHRTHGVNVQMLNAMFWPTLLFVVGVVGLFFGWIHLSGDEKPKKKKKRHHQVPLRDDGEADAPNKITSTA